MWNVLGAPSTRHDAAAASGPEGEVGASPSGVTLEMGADDAGRQVGCYSNAGAGMYTAVSAVRECDRG